MKNLTYLIKRMQKQEIAKKLGIAGSNITLWLLTKRIPRKHLGPLEAIAHKEATRESKTKK